MSNHFKLDAVPRENYLMDCLNVQANDFGLTTTNVSEMKVERRKYFL